MRLKSEVDRTRKQAPNEPNDKESRLRSKQITGGFLLPLLALGFGTKRLMSSCSCLKEARTSMRVARFMHSARSARAAHSARATCPAHFTRLRVSCINVLACSTLRAAICTLHASRLLHSRVRTIRQRAPKLGSLKIKRSVSPRQPQG